MIHSSNEIYMPLDLNMLSDVIIDTLKKNGETLFQNVCICHDVFKNYTFNSNIYKK